jgi:hypothetical protein
MTTLSRDDVIVSIRNTQAITGGLMRSDQLLESAAKVFTATTTSSGEYMLAVRRMKRVKKDQTTDLQYIFLANLHKVY